MDNAPFWKNIYKNIFLCRICFFVFLLFRFRFAGLKATHVSVTTTLQKIVSEISSYRLVPWKLLYNSSNLFHVTGLFLYPLKTSENLQKKTSGVKCGVNRRLISLYYQCDAIPEVHSEPNQTSKTELFTTTVKEQNLSTIFAKNSIPDVRLTSKNPSAFNDRYIKTALSRCPGDYLTNRKLTG